MSKRILKYLVMLVAIIVAISNPLSAQQYNRERLRGNVRTINQGGLVPIDHQVHIALTEAQLGAGQAVELLRQRQQRVATRCTITISTQ